MRALGTVSARRSDLIRYGRDEKLFAFTDDVTANCARKQARSDSDPCGRDLPRSAEGAVVPTIGQPPRCGANHTGGSATSQVTVTPQFIDQLAKVDKVLSGQW
jgi:hypothetical protein